MIRQISILAAICAMTAAAAFAQRQAGDTPVPTIRERTAGMQKFEGFFNPYWEERAERLWLEIDKPGIEFLYVTDLSSSLEGRNRGSWNGGQSLKFDRYGTKILVTQVGYSYRAVTSDPAILKLRPELASLRSVPGYNPAGEEISRMLPREST